MSVARPRAKKLSASERGVASPPDQGLCLWTPLGALPPDPRYARATRARRKLPMARLFQYSGAGADSAASLRH